MSSNDVLISLFIVAALALALLAVIGDQIVKSAKAKRAAAEAKKREEAREASLYARYQRTRADVERAAGLQ